MIARSLLLAVVFSLVGIPGGIINDGDGQDATTLRCEADPISECNLVFTENLGQWDDEVLFRCTWGGVWSWFTRTGVVHLIEDGKEGASARIDFLNGEEVGAAGIDDLGYPTNFFRDDISITGARSYREVLYKDVWPDIDIRYRSEKGYLKYDILVGEWADPDMILFKVSGHRDLASSGDSMEIALTDDLFIQDTDLVSFDSSNHAVCSKFKVFDDRTYGFEVDKKPGESIVIDPLIYSTYLGGSMDDDADLCVDENGYIYLSGTTESADFPILNGIQGTLNTMCDVFVTKMVPNGSSLVFSTYIGGSKWEFFGGMTLDEDNNIFVTGDTNSIDFPTTKGAFQEDNLNSLYNDIFITKLNRSGDVLLFSTYISGDWYENSNDIDTLDGCAIICGKMESHNFPTENGPVGGVHGTAFYLRMNYNGSSINDTCFWDTMGSEQAVSLDVDINGDIVIGGIADPSFPISPGAYRSDPRNMSAPLMFILKYSPTLETTVFSSLLGAKSNDNFGDLCTDQNGDILFAGNTRGWQGSYFPTTIGAYDTILNGSIDGVIGKLSGDGRTLIFSTLLGGDSDEMITGIEVDPYGCPNVIGYTNSQTNLSVTFNCLDPSFNGVEDAFVAKLDPNGTSLLYLTYLGGTDVDRGSSITVTGNNNIAVSGYTRSVDFPITNGAYQPSNKGYQDAFVTIFDYQSAPMAPLNLTAVSGDSDIVLNWKPPAYDGGAPISNYSVYRGNEPNALSLLTVLGNESTYTDRELVVGNVYHYSISCSNIYGEGALCPTVSNRSMTLPGPPLNFSALSYFNFIYIAWSPPEFTGGSKIIVYDLSRGINGTIPVHLVRLDGKTMDYNDRYVEDSTKYDYSLTASNSFGASPETKLTVRMTGPPTPPRNLSYTYDDRTIILHWDPPIDAMGLTLLAYKIYRIYNESAPVLVNIVSSQSLKYVDENVQNGITYQYRITAENAKGVSAFSEPIEAMSRTVPSSPRNVTAAWSIDHMTILWAPPDSDGGSVLKEYRIYYKGNESDYSWIGSVDPSDDDLTFVQAIPFESVIRFYYVTAVNDEGESLPGRIKMTKPPEIPGRPIDLTARSGDGIAWLEWRAPEYDGGAPILGYIIYRWNGSIPVPEYLLTTGPNGSDLVDEELKNGIEYHYFVTAFNMAGEGEESDSISIIPRMELGPIKNLIAFAGSNGITLTWEPPENDGSLIVAGYYIYRLPGDDNDTLQKIDQTYETHYLDAQVKSGSSYVYAVAPFTDQNEGPLGKVVEVTAIGLSDPPSDVWADLIDGKVVLRWSYPIKNGGMDIAHFVVKRYHGSPVPDLELAIGELIYIDPNVTRGDSYTYHVFAVTGFGTSFPAEATIQIPLIEEEPKEKEKVIWPYFVIVGSLLIIVSGILAVTRIRKKDVWEE